MGMPLGREMAVEVEGKRWTLGRMTVEVIDRFLDWIKPQIPNPLEGLKEIIAALPAEQALALVREAQAKREAILDYSSPWVEKFLNTPRGFMHFVLFLVQIHHPEATIADAMVIVEELGPEGLQRVLSGTRGEVPAGKGSAPTT